MPTLSLPDTTCVVFCPRQCYNTRSYLCVHRRGLERGCECFKKEPVNTKTPVNGVVLRCFSSFTQNFTAKIAQTFKCKLHSYWQEWAVKWAGCIGFSPLRRTLDTTLVKIFSILIRLENQNLVHHQYCISPLSIVSLFTCNGSQLLILYTHLKPNNYTLKE